MRCPRPLITAAASAVFLFVPLAAQAESVVCREREYIVNSLTRKFKERPVVIGLTRKGKMIEIFAAADGNWTAVITTTEKLACVVEAGNSLQLITDPKTPGTPN